MTARLGYAIGAGLACLPVVGIPLRFAFQGVASPLVYAGAFLLGAVAGLLLAPRSLNSSAD